MKESLFYNSTNPSILTFSTRCFSSWGDNITQAASSPSTRNTTYIILVPVDSFIGLQKEQQREHDAGPQQQPNWKKGIISYLCSDVTCIWNLLKGLHHSFVAQLEALDFELYVKAVCLVREHKYYQTNKQMGITVV